MESHLLQMRGLKLVADGDLYARIRSHLLQMRGLKPFKKRPLELRVTVASFTDAWIETSTT